MLQEVVKAATLQQHYGSLLVPVCVRARASVCVVDLDCLVSSISLEMLMIVDVIASLRFFVSNKNLKRAFTQFCDFMSR